MAKRLYPWDLSNLAQDLRADILANPKETPRIECKRWLDLNDSRHKAVIAKAAIALANSGGGVIVFGVVEDETQAKHFNCVPRPDGMKRYTADAVASAINQYAEPTLDFRLEFENHPESRNEHAFVEFSGGIQQPVFAKKQLDGVIKKFACYIRKPGPKSEEPHTAQEWSDLLRRCVMADREGLLGSIRTIMDGRPMDTTPTKSEEDKLREFMATSKARWQERVNEVDDDDVSRLPYGYWAFAFSIVGAPRWQTMKDLRRALEEARPAGLRHRLFNDTGGRDRAPYAAEEGSIEAWTGHPSAGQYRIPYDCSFWRATLGGEFYHLEGFLEDSYPNRIEPGTRLFTDLSLELHAMMLKLAARIVEVIGAEAEIVISSEMTGLKGRYLTNTPVRGEIVSYEWLNGWLSSIDTDPLQPRRLAPQQVNDNLVEILYDFLYPLYEKFNFYELKKGWVEKAVDNVNSDGW